MLEGTENISVCSGLSAEQNLLFGNLLSEIEGLPQTTQSNI